jgi:hypothetical protein
VELIGPVALVAEQQRVEPSVQEDLDVAANLIDESLHTFVVIEQWSPGQRRDVRHGDEGLVNAGEN